MAPALTEPLSPNNKLTASTSSVSPTPSISASQHHQHNNNQSRRSLLKSSNNAISYNNTQNNKITNGNNKNFGTIDNKRSTGTNGVSNNNLNPNSKLLSRSLTPNVAFQSAFEESIKKAGISLPAEPQTNKKKEKYSSTVIESIVISKPKISIIEKDESSKDKLKTHNNNNNNNNKNNKLDHSQNNSIGLKENFETNCHKIKGITESVLKNNKNNNNNNNITNFNNNSSKVSNGPPSTLLSTSSIVQKSNEKKDTSAKAAASFKNIDKSSKILMGPMSSEKAQKSFSENFDIVEDRQILPKSVKNLSPGGFIPIDKDFEQAINNTLKIYTTPPKKETPKQIRDPISLKEDDILLRDLQDLQQMDLPNNPSNSGNKNNNVNRKIETLINENVRSNEGINIIKNNINSLNKSVSNTNTEVVCILDKNFDDAGGIIFDCDGRNQQSAVDIDFAQQEIRSTGTTDTTVSASEGDNNFLDEHFQDPPQILSLPNSQIQSPIRISTNNNRITKTPVSSSHQQLSQVIGTPISNIMTPQSINLGSSGSLCLPKDFKDTEMDDQVLSDMDLLQVLKGLDPGAGGDNLCDLAGNLGLFNDVDVMTNYEDIAIPNTKDQDITLDTRTTIEKYHQQMERKCDYLLRRLRKLQSRYMAKHTSDEISGLFEWTNRLVRRKDQHEQIPSLTYDEDKHRPVSATTMRTLLRKIDSVARTQHSNSTDPSSQPLKKYKFASRSSSDLTSITPSNSRDTEKKVSNLQSATSVIKLFDEKTTEEIGHVAGLLHSEMRQTQCSFDSDATVSSSGGESADEMVTYNNQSQQPLSISKRAGWRWARDRSSIATRWTWLCSQIADLEYRIRQYNELYLHIRKNKGLVLLDVKQSTTFQNQKSNKSDNRNKQNEQTTHNSNNVNGYRGSLSSNNEIRDEFDDILNSVNEEDDDLGCSRTRHFKRTEFRKRKLLQTANVHTVSKKAAKPSFHCSTVKCGCQWPFNPCALCTGRPDPTAPRDLPDTMMIPERVALLDPTYHPVLSFTEDVPIGIHVEAVLHSAEWQNKLIRSISKNLKNSNKKSDDLNSNIHKNSSGDVVSMKRPYNKSGGYSKHRKELNSSTSTNKIKKSRKNQDYPLEYPHHSETAQFQQNSSNSLIKNHKHRKISSTILSSSLTSTGGDTKLSNSIIPDSILSNSKSSNGFQNAFTESLLNSFQCDNLDGSSNGLLPRSKNASPTPPGCSSKNKYDRSLERKNRNSYDIDNIVIPYSVAASTRVEILPYKEIPTPHWRVIDDNEEENMDDSEMMLQNESFENEKKILEMNNELAKDTNTKTFTEDISEVAIQSRHEKALLEERKKFSTYLKFPWSTRSRANRRIDSRAESSGTNTPDPTSPAPQTPSLVGDQESIPSPAGISTPLVVQGDFEQDPFSQNSGHRRERKRTVSSKKDKELSFSERCLSPDTREIIPPYEPLKFPIEDKLYNEMLELMPNFDENYEIDDISNNLSAQNNDISNSSSSKLEIFNRSYNNNNNNNISCDTITSSTKVNNNSIISNSSLSSSILSKGFEKKSSYDKETNDENNDLYEYLIKNEKDGYQSETDSIESNVIDDPNDPEWKEPE